MILLTATLRAIADLQPPPLPALPAPRLPDVSAAQALARTTGGNADPLVRAARSLESDADGIGKAEAEAKRMALACLRDLVGIGAEFLRRALPVAVGLLIPHPATRVAAEAALRALAAQALAKAMERLRQLVSELATLVPALLEIAQRAARSALGPGAAEARQSLKEERGIVQAAVPQPEPVAEPEPAPEPAAAPNPTGSEQGRRAAQAALAQVGTPYVWGGTGGGGFDCSGLTQYAYRQAGIELPRLAQEQTVGTQVSAGELQAGDLVVWDGHVAMYIGDGQIVEAGDPVQTNPLRTTNMGMTFKGFWRPTA